MSNWDNLFFAHLHVLHVLSNCMCLYLKSRSFKFLPKQRRTVRRYFDLQHLFQTIKGQQISCNLISWKKCRWLVFPRTLVSNCCYERSLDGLGLNPNCHEERHFPPPYPEFFSKISKKIWIKLIWPPARQTHCVL